MQTELDLLGFAATTELKIELPGKRAVRVRYRLIDGTRLHWRPIAGLDGPPELGQREEDVIVTACWNALCERGWRSPLNTKKAPERLSGAQGGVSKPLRG